MELSGFQLKPTDLHSRGRLIQLMKAHKDLTDLPQERDHSTAGSLQTGTLAFIAYQPANSPFWL